MTFGILRQQGSNWKFQLTRSRGAWPYLPQKSENHHTHFNSHAHVERDKICKYGWGLFTISTHTLTWSVTVQIRQFLGQQTFQLTRSRGAWPQKNSPKAVIKIISTHTLTWSVTTAVLQLVRITKISTHTLTWSVTCIIDKTIRFVKFQLTRSRGAWPLK